MTAAAKVGHGDSFPDLERRVVEIEAGLLALEPVTAHAPAPPVHTTSDAWRLATVLVILVSAAVFGPILL